MDNPEQTSRLIYVLETVEVFLRYLTPQKLKVLYWRNPVHQRNYVWIADSVFQNEIVPETVKNIYSEITGQMVKNKLFKTKYGFLRTAFFVLQTVVDKHPEVLEGEWPVNPYDWGKLIKWLEGRPAYEKRTFIEAQELILSEANL